MVCQGNHLQPSGAAQLDGLFFLITTAVAVAAMHLQVGLIPGGASGRVVTHTFTSVACWMAATDSATRHWPASMGAAQKAGREANSALPCTLFSARHSSPAGH